MPVYEKETLPRERLEKDGPESLSTSDLLALILGRGTAEKNVFALSEELAEFLSKAARRPNLEELCQIGGLGRAKSLSLNNIEKFAMRCYILRKKKRGAP